MKTLLLLITLLTSFLSGIEVCAQTSPTNQRGYSESQSYEPRVWPEPAGKKKKKLKKEDKAAVNVSPQNSASAVLVEPKELRIPVSVFDQTGKPVAGLHPSDFKVYVGDQEQQIASVRSGHETLNLVMVFDVSPSAQPRFKQMQQFASDMVHRLHPDDKVMVIALDDNMKILADLTSDRTIIGKALSKLRMGNGTSLYDSVTRLFELHFPSIAGRKALVVFTDGIDTTSKKATYESSLVAAETGEATIYPVYFDTWEDVQRSMRSIPKFPDLFGPLSGVQFGHTEQQREIGKFFLNDLCSLSGGRPIDYEAVKTGKSVVKIGLVEDLRSQYILTFMPTTPVPVGQRKKIHVRVNFPNLIVLARGSYVFAVPVGPKK